MFSLFITIVVVLGIFLAGALFHAKNGEKFDKFVEWILRYIDNDR